MLNINIYWYYKDESGDVLPTEELFDLKNDPYEMINLAGDLNYEKELKRMRKLYDKQLKQWKKEGVKYNDYQKYETLFKRLKSI